MDDPHSRVPLRQLVGKLPRSIGRIVIYDYDSGVKSKLQDAWHQFLDIVSLVVGGDDDCVSIQSRFHSSIKTRLIIYLTGG